MLLVAAFALVVPVGLGAPAWAAAGDGNTTRFDVSLVVQSDGTVQVREDITYDFTDYSHGIERYIPVRYQVDDTYDRVLTISDVSVSSPSGAPTDLQTEEQGGVYYLRIGSPDQTFIGEQRYVITYDVTGALNSFPDHAELYWDAIGTDWRSPILKATVDVKAPAIQQATCFYGPQGANSLCSTSDVGSRVAQFGQRGLAPGEGMTVAVAMPSSAVTVPPPVLEVRWTPQRAFSADPPHVAASVALLVVGVGAVSYLGYRRGRDRRFRGQVPGLAPMPGQEGESELRPVGQGAEGPVEWLPPDDVRPGLVGTLIDEQANVLDVTATIVDLAVRGYIRIDELPREGRFSSRDWQLVQLKAADPSLMQYERTLYDAIFKSSNVVALSSLKQHFRSDLSNVQSQLYDEMVYRRWYNRRPDTTRTSWSVLAIVAIAAAAGLTYLLARFTTFGLVGIALVVAAIALFVTARFMPARTPAGSAMTARILGFKRYLATAEADQLRFEEPEQVFSRYLPYAIVFGVTDHWAKVFQQLAASGTVSAGAGAASLYWYTGPGGWNFTDFSSSISSFSTVAAGSLSAAAASGGSGFSGGGFSGGGFGGGGGGGW
jgi:uncharacterized protein (TIGR04222 family)